MEELKLDLREVKLLKTFFNKFSLEEKKNWHLIQVVSYFLELCGISYQFLKLKWHWAVKPPSSSNVHYFYNFVEMNKQHVEKKCIGGGGPFQSAVKTSSFMQTKGVDDFEA